MKLWPFCLSYCLLAFAQDAEKPKVIVKLNSLWIEDRNFVRNSSQKQLAIKVELRADNPKVKKSEEVEVIQTKRLVGVHHNPLKILRNGFPATVNLQYYIYAKDTAGRTATHVTDQNIVCMKRDKFIMDTSPEVIFTEDGHERRGDFIVTKYVECSCNEKYFGEKCDIFCESGNDCTGFKDPCKHAKCRNGGTCQDISKVAYRCICPFEWLGKDCTLARRQCEDLKCHYENCSYNSGGIYRCNCGLSSDAQHCGPDIYHCPISKNLACDNFFECAPKEKSPFICKCSKPAYGKKCDKCNGRVTRTGQCVEGLRASQLEPLSIVSLVITVLLTVYVVIWLIYRAIIRAQIIREIERDESIPSDLKSELTSFESYSSYK